MKLVVELAVVVVHLVTLVGADMVVGDTDVDVVLLAIILMDVAMDAMADTPMPMPVTMVGVHRQPLLLLLRVVEDMVVADVVVDLDVVMDVAMGAMDVAVDEVTPVAGQGNVRSGVADG